MNLKDLIVYLNYITLFINVFLYIKSYRKFSIAFKFISIYLVISLIIQLSAEYIASYKGNNLFLLHYFNIFQFIFLSLFYFKIFTSKSLKKIVLYGLIIMSLGNILNILFTSDYYYNFNLFEIVLLNIPLIIYSFIFLIRRIDSKNKRFIYFNSGFFVYTSCSVLLFSAGHISSEIKTYLWGLNQILYIFYQILIFIDWYKNFRKKTTLST